MSRLWIDEAPQGIKQGSQATMFLFSNSQEFVQENFLDILPALKDGDSKRFTVDCFQGRYLTLMVALHFGVLDPMELT